MSWWQYLLLVNLYVALFYGFYALLLRSETFFKLNRIYLVASALLSFLIPLIHSNWVRDLFITRKVEDTIMIYSHPIMVYNLYPAQEQQITIGQLLMYIYAAGALVLMGRFVWQLISLKKLIDQPVTSGAFSFFSSIRLGNDTEDNSVIAAHEQVHARELHSADILLIEAISIINWFNPVVYLYRLAIKHIHEFIADRHAVESGTTKAEYALLLLSQTLKTPAHQLSNPFFNQSLLKRRIIMLQKNRSQRTALLKYGLSAPLFILMLILSSATISKSRTVNLLSIKAEDVFLTPAPTLNSGAKDTVRLMDAEPAHLSGLQPAATLASNPETNNADTLKKTGPIFTQVERMAEFPGGMTAFMDFLTRNMRYPSEMRKNNIHGTEFITFVVEKDGSLSDIKPVRDLGYGAAEESERVLTLSPKWQPGIQNGKLVRVQYTIPLKFNLAKDQSIIDTTGKAVNVVTTGRQADYSVGNNPQYQISNDSGQKNAIVIKGIDSGYTLLYLLDGKEISDLSKVNPNDIESINVIKPQDNDKKNALMLMYGPKAENGVILIKTKDAVKKTDIQKH